MEIIKGKILEIIFQNEDNGYTIANIIIKESGQTTIQGCMPTVQPGEEMEFHGQWVYKENYGRQFKVESFIPLIPDSKDGIISYLSSGIVKGIGEKMAEKIVSKFGVTSLEVIEKTPQRLMEIEGIGPKKLKSILESYEEGRELRSLMVKLLPYSITPNQCMRIYKKFKDKSLDTVFNNPYKLAEEIRGIGFKTADKIGSQFGIPKDSPDRIREGILYILSESLQEGHVYLPKNELIERSSKLLLLQNENIEAEIQGMAIQGKIHVEGQEEQRVYLLTYYMAENQSASRVIEIVEREIEDLSVDLEEKLEEIEESHGLKLAANQREAVRQSLKNPMMILTGGPGTGKTTTIKAIIEIFKTLKKKVELAAPTGRAAKRMTEATKMEAKTIHRLLEVGYVGDDDSNFYNKDEENPIDADVVILDEVSMVDINLFHNVMEAIGRNTRLILVGDKDQLPSVGAGNVLGDLISSKVVQVVELNEIFRQAQESMIIVNAHRINKGEMPLLNQKDKDFFFLEENKKENLANYISTLCKERLSTYYDLDPKKDMQILGPMRRGETGVQSLNIVLQEALNPPSTYKKEHKFGNRIFRVGDKVMQIRNNYQKTWKLESSGEEGEGVFNGDIGFIDFVDTREKKLHVLYEEDKRVIYEFSELEELEHCFATTIHKSQGSEFPVVVMPITWAPPMLLNRNLLYTGITRASKLVVLVGEKRYLEMMVKNQRAQNRYSNLGEKLKRALELGADFIG